MFHPMCPEGFTSASGSTGQDFLLRISHIPTHFCFFFCFSSMGRRSDSFLFLVLSGIFLAQAAMADGNDKSEVAMMSPSEVKVEDQAEAAAASAASIPSSSSSEAGAPAGIRKMGKHHSDKSVAGGGVIIGGLVTAIFAAVFCYIRVTRRRDAAAAAGGGPGHCGR